MDIETVRLIYESLRKTLREPAVGPQSEHAIHVLFFLEQFRVSGVPLQLVADRYICG